MANFLITWTMDIEADTPREAAEAALHIQGETIRIANSIFDVFDGVTTVSINLEDKVNNDGQTNSIC